jgi:hypothetical protein
MRIGIADEKRSLQCRRKLCPETMLEDEDKHTEDNCTPLLPPLGKWK